MPINLLVPSRTGYCLGDLNQGALVLAPGTSAQCSALGRTTLIPSNGPVTGTCDIDLRDLPRTGAQGMLRRCIVKAMKSYSQNDFSAFVVLSNLAARLFDASLQHRAQRTVVQG